MRRFLNCFPDHFQIFEMVAKDAAMINDENLRIIFKKEKVNLIVRDIEIAEA